MQSSFRLSCFTSVFFTTGSSSAIYLCTAVLKCQRRSVLPAALPCCASFGVFCRNRLQSHPARDAHDTFFIKDPASALVCTMALRIYIEVHTYTCISTSLCLKKLWGKKRRLLGLNCFIYLRPSDTWPQSAHKILASCADREFVSERHASATSCQPPLFLKSRFHVLCCCCRRLNTCRCW